MDGAGTDGAGSDGAGSDAATDVGRGNRRRRDLGTAALAVAVLLPLLALAQPLSVLTATSATGTPAGTSTVGWFGAVHVAGAASSSPGSAPALGWAVLGGVAALALAVLVRLRVGSARGPALGGGTSLLATGALVLLAGRAREARVAEVLTGLVPGEVALRPSASPWLLVVAGALALLTVAARPRDTGLRARRSPAPGVVEWTPVPPAGRT